ncbi:sigma-E factor negative regulatory protein [Stenotrophomonas sp. AB1(2024)]|uniref:sigma-E factor negative regulatory protein n=1 Tax=Stenotrophomonas sp. AB1(2024) TaxID=3132215 RepID=UPI0038FBC2B2
MNHEMPDKFDAHHRQQLSALVDGELPLEEARFLLRRLEHDEALSGCHERWQLLGDVLRGQACAPAPLGFAERIQLVVAAEPAPVLLAATSVPRERRGSLLRWGGGAALAASVAAIALFMSREQLPGQLPPDAPITIIASQAQLPPAPPRAPLNPTVVADAALAVAAVPAAAVNARRTSATRTQQAARSVASRSAEPVRAVASAPAPTPVVPAIGARSLPFVDAANLQARPWPRSTLGSNGALNASFSTQEPQAAFYPFEPRLQDDAADAPPARRQRD